MVNVVVMLSILDIITGLLYFYDKSVSSILLIGLLWFHLIKGVLSLLGSISSGYFFDWMGTIDLLAGIAVLIRGSNILTTFFSYVMILLIIKGTYTLLRGLFKT
ncbi:MAG: hypothetical protein GXN99_01095 [Candidatus Nanohaloarchaeota archaeon]|nr:hypothetical protein [Candidatus Nanohaloarchaeota archaeon]